MVKNNSAKINKFENLINDYFTHACWVEGDYNNKFFTSYLLRIISNINYCAIHVYNMQHFNFNHSPKTDNLWYMGPLSTCTALLE